jgi:hypothetical protein
MLGRNRGKPQTTLVSQEISAGPKPEGEDAAKGPRPVHRVDGARAVTTQR